MFNLNLLDFLLELYLSIDKVVRKDSSTISVNRCESGHNS